MLLKHRNFRLNLFMCISLFAGSSALFAQSSTTTITNSPGAHSQDTTVTAANGKTATYQNNANWSNGTYTDNRTVTGFNGKTATQDVTRSNGQATKTVTGPNGHSRTYSRRTRWWR